MLLCTDDLTGLDVPAIGLMRSNKAVYSTSLVLCFFKEVYHDSSFSTYYLYSLANAESILGKVPEYRTVRL